MGEQRTEADRSWRLVAREKELQRIAAARADGHVAIVIDGAAGLGKSRLAREALASAESDGAGIAWVQASRSAASVSLGAFAGLIPPEVRSDDPFELMQQSVLALRERSGGRPLVLAVDDAQWLDPVSAALTMQLASTGTAFVVATVRTGEVSPDAIVWLWKDAGAPRLELGLLGSIDTGALVEAIAGGPVERQARRWAYEASRGNALYVRELVLGALATGALDPANGLWRLNAVPSMTASLGELITARLVGLSEPERRLGELLSLGEPLRLSEMTALAGAEPLRAMQARGLISVDSLSAETPVRLAHPLYGEVIRAALPSLRARDARLTLAQTLAARDPPEPADTLRIARWLTDAGEPLPVDVMIAAARDANLAGDPAFAAELASGALQAGAGIEAALLLARARTVQGDFARAEDVLLEAAQSIKTQQHALEYLERQSEVLHWGLGRPAELRTLLERAAGWWDEPGWRERLEPLRVRVSSFERLGSGAAASIENLPTAHPGEQVARELEPVSVANLFYSGRTRDALRLAERLRPKLPVRTLDEAVALGIWGRITLETGEDWPELDAWMSGAIETGVQLNDHASAGQAAYWLACLRFLQGRYLDAGAILAEADSQLGRHDPLALRAVVSALQVGVAWATGDLSGVDAALERAQRRLPSEGALAHQRPHIVRATAWASRAHGDHGQAQRLLLGSADALSQSPIHAAMLTYEAMLAGASARRLTPSLASLRERCDARLAAAYAAHAAALAARDGALLIEVAGEMEQIGALRYATEAAADAARCFLDAGRQDSARRALAKSRELFTDAQGAPVPALDGLDGPGVELTAREAQLVQLASQGLRNAQIAERLVLSVRTVESHLYRAMQKLGISDRRDL